MTPRLPRIEELSMLKWYCYEHINGSLHLKRYLGDPLDLAEARESSFVKRVRGPFEAENYEEAMKHMNEVFRVAKKIEHPE